jgi:chitosanase
MLTELQKRTAQAIVNVFETGSPRGDYGMVTIQADDAGHLTYGRSQTTLASGNLHLLIQSYCETPGASYARGLRAYLAQLQDRDITLDGDAELHGLLKSAGDDPVMRDVQDRFFDRVYWQPSVRIAAGIPVELPLSVAVLYDSFVHGSSRLIRDRTRRECGSPDSTTERSWVAGYVRIRREWLASRRSPLLRVTVYRMEDLGRLIAEGRWGLELPLVVRGQVIDEGAVLSPA